MVILGFAPRVSSLETTGGGEGKAEGAEVSYFRHDMVWLLQGRMEVQREVPIKNAAPNLKRMSFFCAECEQPSPGWRVSLWKYYW